MGNGTTALARANDTKPTEIMAPSSRMAVTARSLNDVYAVAESVHASGMYGVKSPQDAFLRMLTGLELGLGMAQSLRGVYVINNRPSLDASLMTGVCLSHPDLCEYFQLVESTAERATYVTKRRGAPKEVTMTYTIDEARKADLVGKDTWKKFPANMLRARASSNLARAVYPDLLNGLYTPDEAEDIPPEPMRAQVVSSQPVRVGDTEADLAVKIAKATDMPKIAKAIKDAALDDAARERLKALFLKRREEVKAAMGVAPPAQPAPPAPSIHDDEPPADYPLPSDREPGSDG
jgi:hypothetical protein